MVEPGNMKINMSRQAELLSTNRTGLYRVQTASTWAEIDLLDMRMIDEIYTAKPIYGYRRITEEMQRGGRSIKRKTLEIIEEACKDLKIYPVTCSHIPGSDLAVVRESVRR